MSFFSRMFSFSRNKSSDSPPGPSPSSGSTQPPLLRPWTLPRPIHPSTLAFPGIPVVPLPADIRHPTDPKPESLSEPPLGERLRVEPSPWSVHHLNLLPPTFLSKRASPSGLSPSPFPRFGYALSATASATGELFLFGGYVGGSASKDSYAFSWWELSATLSATLLQTSGEAPSPRLRHVGARFGTVLLIWGGATNVSNKGEISGPYDDSLYLLDIVSREWTRVMVNGPRPIGRYGHAATMVGSKLFVFGGKADGKYLHDMWTFDLDSLKSKPVWDSYEPAPGDERPPPRADHVLVATGDRIILFGGRDGRSHYNDTWLFDVSTGQWNELRCTGCIPSPRRGHAAAVVDEVMYVFGGSGIDEADLGDLSAFELSTQRWSVTQNSGPRPIGGRDHAMASDGTQVFVLGGPSSVGAQADKIALIYVLHPKLIKLNPNPIAVELSEKTTQVSWKLSTGSRTPEHPHRLTSSSSDVYGARRDSRFQKATPDELGRSAPPRITHERYPTSKGLPLQPPGLDVSSEREVAPFARSEQERLLELERQLSATLAEQSERDHRLAQLTDELARKSALLEQTEANAVEAAKRAGLEPREQADRLLAQTSPRVEHADAEFVEMQAKLDEQQLSRDQQVRALEQRIGQYETKQAELRAELEARKYELEAVRSRQMKAELASLQWGEKDWEDIPTRNEG